MREDLDFDRDYRGEVGGSFSPGILGMLIEAGAIRLLKGSWVVERARRRDPIVRRQELPDEAFWPAGDAVRLWGKNYPGDTHFFCALSYGWIQQGDPDRDCFTLGRVGAILAMHLAYFGQDYWVG